jgi:hypothetical protein
LWSAGFDAAAGWITSGAEFVDAVFTSAYQEQSRLCSDAVRQDQILELAVPPFRASDGTYDGRDATGSRLLALFHPLLGVTFKAT